MLETKCEKRQINMTMFQIASIVCALYLAIILIRSAYHFLDANAFVRDGSFYWVVGKGMLSGLIPYVDLFETKPPGIFMLSSISFNLFHTPILGQILGALTLIVLPVLGVLSARKYGKTLLSPATNTLSLLGFFLGGLWSMFLVTKVGPWQTELFGSLFGSSFIALMIVPVSRMRTALMSVCLLCAIGIKEPFILSILGGVMLLIEKPKELITSFFIPLLLASILGVIILLSLGYLGPYLSVYIPVMLEYRIQTSVSVLYRIFGYGILAKNLWHVSVVLPFALATTLLAQVVLVFSSIHSQRLVHGLLTLIGLSLAVASIGIAGDFQAHHFGFFTPFVVALIISLHKKLSLRWDSYRVRRSAYFILALLMASTVTLGWPNDPRWQSSYTDVVKQDAESIDTILDDCRVDRYLEVLGTSNQLALFTYARHLPLNQSVFVQIDEAYQYGQIFLDESVHRISTAQIIVLPKNGFTPSNDIGKVMKEYIDTAFTSKLPNCVGPHYPSEFQVLYRQSLAPLNLNVAVKYQ